MTTTSPPSAPPQRRNLTHLGLGTAAMASSRDAPIWCGPTSRSDALDTIAMAIEHRIAFVDTAPFYGWGTAERLVGEAFRSAGQRVPVYTKCGIRRLPDGSFVDDSSPWALRDGVLRSRDLLGVERIDIVQIHDPDPTTPIEDSWAALMQLVDDGVIGGAGLSNHDAAAMERASAVGPVSVVQHQYSLLHRRPEHDGTLRWTESHGVPLLAWSPLACGYLADGFDLSALDHDDLRRRLPWAGDTRLPRLLDALDEIAERTGSSRAGVAVSWLSSRRTVPIVGARTTSELQLHLDAAAPLDGVDLQLLDDLTREGRTRGR